MPLTVSEGRGLQIPSNGLQIPSNRVVLHAEGNEVAVALVQAGQQVCRIAAHFYAEPYTKTIGELLAHQVVHTEMAALVVVVGVGSGEGKGYQLAGLLNGGQVEAFVSNLCPPNGRWRLWRRLLCAGRESQYP